jgi:glycerate 2-kinase
MRPSSQKAHLWLLSLSLGFRPKDVLADNDAHTLFTGLGDSIVTGPTHTNVNDFRAILIEAGA